MIDKKIIDALPTPDGPGPFEGVVSACRIAERDVIVRCLETGAQRHFVLDDAGNILHDSRQPEESTLAAFRGRRAEVGGQGGEIPTSA